jgi:hypothetical protein
MSIFTLCLGIAGAAMLLAAVIRTVRAGDA